MKAKIITQLLPDKPSKVTPSRNVPYMYWPLGSDNVGKIGTHVKNFGRMTLYPKEHVEAMMKVIEKWDIPLFINPLLFTMVPQLDLPISDDPQFVHDQYGVITCDLIQVLCRANIANVKSCHYPQKGYHGQFGYIGNPFFGTFWVYNSETTKVGFGHYSAGDADPLVKEIFNGTTHKRNVNPLASVNFFVGYNTDTGAKTVFLSHVYGDNTHFRNALPKLLLKLQELGYEVCCNSCGERTASGDNRVKFATIPKFLTIAASLKELTCINPYRSPDVTYPSAFRVEVVGEDGKDHNHAFMVCEFKRAYQCYDAQYMVIPLKTGASANNRKSDLKEATKLGTFERIITNVAPAAHYDMGLRDTCRCPRCKKEVETQSIKTVVRKKYCPACLQKAFFFDGVNNEYVPYENMGKNHRGDWLTPRAIKAGGYELDKTSGYYVIPPKVENVGIFTITMEKVQVA